MTKQELSQLYWLRKEIADGKARLAELESAAAGRAVQITGLPHIAGLAARDDRLAVLLARQRELVRERVRASIDAYNRLSGFIASVQDAQMREILTLRYVKGLSWQRVAFAIGESDESYPRRRHNAFLRKSKPAENAGQVSV